MAVSKTSVVNDALTRCGAAPITNITDDTNNARIANRCYEIALKRILSETKWTFATTRGSLSLSAQTMPWNHTDENYVYTRPATCLRIFGTNHALAVWREEGEYIISDTASLGIEYVYYHDDPSKYPGMFLEAFIDLLAAKMAFPIINSSSKADTFMEKYEKISLPAAMAANGQTGTGQQVLDDEWLSAKYGTGQGNQARSFD